MSVLRRVFRVGGIALACAGVLGCAADRVAGVKSSSSRESVPATSASADQACRFNVGSFVDRRDNESLGTVGFTRVDGEGFQQWFIRGIQSVAGYSAQPQSVVLKVETLRAHIHSQATYKVANIVAKVDMSTSGKSPVTKTYRGSDGSINWGSSESEVQEAFDKALKDLKGQIAADIGEFCKTSG